MMCPQTRVMNLYFVAMVLQDAEQPSGAFRRRSDTSGQWRGCAHWPLLVLCAHKKPWMLLPDKKTRNAQTDVKSARVIEATYYA